MAKLDPAWAANGDRRFPSTTEQANGHECGEADRELFNGLQYRLEAELGHLILHSGQTPSDSDLTQVRKAIEQLIGEAIGSLPDAPDTTGFVSMQLLRSRVPFFPNVLTIDGRINVVSPGVGVVRIPAGITFQHRGVFNVVTTQRDFATVASKTYHLRWDPSNGYRLLDTTNVAYNPSAFSESSGFFDSSHDSMLIARVITNASNVVSITNLCNKTMFTFFDVKTDNAPTAPLDNFSTGSFAFTYNLARTPVVTPFLIGAIVGPKRGGAGTFEASDPHDHDQNIIGTSLTRYSATYTARRDHSSSISLGANIIMTA